MTAPKRIRRLRVKGWRKGDAVIVDRTSRFGNPWRVGDPGVPDRAAAVQQFAFAIVTRRIAADTVDELGSYPSDEEIIARLRGRDLACPCPLPEPGEVDHCHARVLINIANGGEGRD